MKKMPIFVSHYTRNTPYEEITKRLISSLHKFGLDYDIEGISPLGSWRANSNYCAWQVQKMLKKHHPRPILRVDADAVVQCSPGLFEQPDFDADIAAVIWYGFRRGGELLGGTLYFANNERVHLLVSRWIELCKLTPLKRNPDLLEKAIWEGNDFLRKSRVWVRECREYIGSVKFVKLPLEYCKIFDYMSQEVKEPVIEHFQASRKYRKLIDGGRRR